MSAEQSPSAPLHSPEVYTLLGVQVHALTIPDLNAQIAQAVADGQMRVIGNHNLHSVYLNSRDEKMRRFNRQADLIHIDGMPLVVWGRLLGYPLRAEHRVTFMDWVWSLMEEAARQGWRVFYLGGKPGVAERAAQVLRARYPGLCIETRHGYFEPAENEAILAQIAAFAPQVLMVGMGMPRQEHWVLDNREGIRANAVLLSGACFDYIAGAVPTPPRWMGRLGLEWLFRLATEPARLAKRYLVEPWSIIPLALKDLAAVRLRKPDR